MSGRRRRVSHERASSHFGLFHPSCVYPKRGAWQRVSEKPAVCDAPLFSAALSSRINNSANRTAIFANICSHWNVNQNTHFLLDHLVREAKPW